MGDETTGPASLSEPSGKPGSTKNKKAEPYRVFKEAAHHWEVFKGVRVESLPRLVGGG